MEPLLRTDEVIRLLGVSRSWFERQVAAGTGPTCLRVGKLRRWRSDDVRSWIEAQVDVGQRLPEDTCTIKSKSKGKGEQ